MPHSNAGTKLPTKISQSHRLHQRCVALGRRLNSPPPIARSLESLGVSAAFADEFELSRQYLDEALILWRESGSPRGVALTLKGLAMLEERVGNLPEAERLYRESLALYQEVGEASAVVAGFCALGELAEKRGEPAAAARDFTAAAAVHERSEGSAGRGSELVKRLTKLRRRLGEAAFQAAAREGRALAPEGAARGGGT